MVWYNSAVKKLLTALLAAATLIAGTAVTGVKTEYAAAENSDETFYPEFVSDLEIGNIDCYAATENKFAFSQGEYIYIYSGGTPTLTTIEEGTKAYVYEGGVMENATDGVYAVEHTSNIISMRYSGDGLLFKDAAGGVYEYADGVVNASAEAFPDDEDIIVKGGLVYSVNDDKMLAVTDMKEFCEDIPQGTYSSVKLENDCVYVLKDGNLCAVEGNTVNDISVIPLLFRYTDTTHAQTIAVGKTAELLKSASSAQFAIVPAGQYLTEIDLSDLSGQYFEVGEEGTFRMKSTANALVLCTSGNADIIVIGQKSYITTTLGARISETQSAAPFEGGQLNYSTGIYSVPYMSPATELLKLEPGATVHISYQIKAADQTAAAGALSADFCKVTYTAEDGTITEGYIATSFLTAYDFSGEDGEFTEPTPPEDYTEENVILTVVLVIVIVVIVIAGVAYLAYSSGASKRKTREQNDEERKG